MVKAVILYNQSIHMRDILLTVGLWLQQPGQAWAGLQVYKNLWSGTAQLTTLYWCFAGAFQYLIISTPHFSQFHQFSTTNHSMLMIIDIRFVDWGGLSLEKVRSLEMISHRASLLCHKCLNCQLTPVVSYNMAFHLMRESQRDNSFIHRRSKEPADYLTAGYLVQVKEWCAG